MRIHLTSSFYIYCLVLILEIRQLMGKKQKLKIFETKEFVLVENENIQTKRQLSVYKIVKFI